LKTKSYLLNDNALILAPLSTQPEGSVEQTYTLLEYQKEFKVIEEIMKTAFSLRVDKERQVNESMDHDYFGTH
jgi:hypothetical protein